MSNSFPESASSTANLPVGGVLFYMANGIVPYVNSGSGGSLSYKHFTLSIPGRYTISNPVLIIGNVTIPGGAYGGSTRIVAWDGGMFQFSTSFISSINLSSTGFIVSTDDSGTFTGIILYEG